MQAKDLISSRQFEQALDALQRYKISSPQDPRGYYYAGMALAGGGRLQEAAAELRQALQLDSDSFAARYALALMLSRLNQLPEAIEVLRVIEDDEPPSQSTPEPLWLLADLHYRQESFQDALRVLDHYARIAPQDLRLTLRRGQIALLEGRFDDAVQLFRQARTQQPESPAIHHGLGLALWRSNDLDEARQSLLRAVELAPQQPEFLLDLGKLLVETGTASEAIPYLERATQADSPPAEAFFELSRAHRRAGNQPEANRYLERFRQLRDEQQAGIDRQEQLGTALRRGQDLLRHGNVRQALQAFQQAVEQDPQSWLAHSYLCKIYLSSNMLSNAAAHLAEMQRLDPESAEGNFLLASYRYRIGDHAQALQAAQKARSARPDYGELRNLLGNIFLALGRPEEAAREYTAALRLEPSREDFRLNLESVKKKEQK